MLVRRQLALTKKCNFMEYAIYFDSLGSGFRQMGNFLKDKRISRLYFGEEFCEELIPDLSNVKESLRYAREKKLDYTYVCGYLSDKALKKQYKIFDYLNRQRFRGKKIEVVVNDWGVLAMFPKNLRI